VRRYARQASGLALAVLAVLAVGSRAEAQEASPPRPASTSVAPVTEVAVLVERARAAEAQGDVEGALAGYRAVVATAPTSRFALQAERRLDWLEPRADDPSALGLLLVFRSRRGRDLAAVEGLEASALAMRPGIVRREALMTVASELDALAAADGVSALVGRAEDAYRRALEEQGLADAERAHLVAGYAGLLGREGRTAEALLVLDEAGHDEGALRSRLELERVDAWARPLALGVLGLLTLTALALVARVARAGKGRALLDVREWALPLVAVSYGALGPYLLGVWYSHEAEHLTGSLALGISFSLAVAATIGRALSIEEAPRALARVAGTLAVLAPLAVGYLAVYGTADGPLAH